MSAILESTAWPLTWLRRGASLNENAAQIQEERPNFEKNNNYGGGGDRRGLSCHPGRQLGPPTCDGDGDEEDGGVRCPGLTWAIVTCGLPDEFCSFVVGF